MKKKFKLLITAIMMITVLFSMAPAAMAAEATVTAPLKTYGTEAPVSKTITYTENNVLSGSDKGTVLPIKVQKAGVLEISFSFSKLEKDFSAALYTDAACTNRLNGTPSFYASFSPGNTGETLYAGVSNAGTYYLKFSSYSYKGSFTNQINLKIAEWPAGDHTIKSGQTIMTYNQSSVKYWDYKYTATANGMVTITHNSRSGYDAQILNASKKALSNEQWCDSGVNRANCQFAVEKGKTYYIRINPNDSSTAIHKMTLKQTAIKEKSGKSKAKAVLLKAKKKAKGTIAPGSKKADWYKIKLKKNKKITVSLSGQASSRLKATVYDRKGKSIGYITLYTAFNQKGTITTFGLKGKASKGTYYIKISRDSAKDSGVYTLSWR